jgi:hypothetical protein
LTRVNNRFRDPFRPSCAEGIAHVEHERRLQRLIRRLPGKIQGDHPLAAPAGLALGAHSRRRASHHRRALSILPFLGL